jgi:hypothetical protein
VASRKKPKIGRLVREGPLDPGKLDTGLRRLIERSPDAELDVIVRVATPDHVPAGLALRARITAHTLTARARARDLPRIAQDPDVISIAGSEPLPLV